MASYVQLWLPSILLFISAARIGVASSGKSASICPSMFFFLFVGVGSFSVEVLSFCGSIGLGEGDETVG